MEITKVGAQEKGKALRKRMRGKGWKADVWKGWKADVWLEGDRMWYYGVYSGPLRVKVRGYTQPIKYQASFQGELRMWVYGQPRRDPNKALESLVQVARRQIAKRIKVIERIEKMLDVE